MKYEESKPLIEKLMDIAILYHASPSILRMKIYAAIDEFFPDLDECCREPVAWMQEGQPELYVKEEKDEKRGYVIPLYTHPQIEQDWSTQDAALESLREHMARIKELEAQIEQMKNQKPVGRFAKFTDGIWREVTDGSSGQPLYTHPQPKREPLTDEQIQMCVELELVNYWNAEYADTTGARDCLTDFARAIEAAHGIKENL